MSHISSLSREFFKFRAKIYGNRIYTHRLWYQSFAGLTKDFRSMVSSHRFQYHNFAVFNKRLPLHVSSHRHRYQSFAVFNHRLSYQGFQRRCFILFCLDIYISFIEFQSETSECLFRGTNSLAVAGILSEIRDILCVEHNGAYIFSTFSMKLTIKAVTVALR